MISFFPAKGVKKGVKLMLPNTHYPMNDLQKHDIQKKTGQTGVPVIKIGSKWIVGFDKEKIEANLGLK